MGVEGTTRERVEAYRCKPTDQPPDLGMAMRWIVQAEVGLRLSAQRVGLRKTECQSQGLMDANWRSDWVRWARQKRNVRRKRK